MGVARLRSTVDQTFHRLLAENDEALVESFSAARPSIAERLEIGKALREKLPRKAHEEFKRDPARVDVLGILEQQNKTRVQSLVPVRYGRMLVSPFAFLRGAAGVMAADLSTTPVTGIPVAACGDMHVSNFGVFGSAERNLIFAINDFDEVHPGPWEWDLKRLSASAAVAMKYQGGDKASCEQAAREIVRSYRKHIRRYAEMGYLDVWYDYVDERRIFDTLPPKQRRRARWIIDKARTRGHVTVLDKLTELVGDKRRIVEEAPLIVREKRLSDGTPVDAALDQVLRTYMKSLTLDRRRLLARYRVVDVVRKVVGVGSVGTGCWIVMLEGVDSDDPLFLQIKQAQPSVLAPYVDYKLPFDDQGRRVVAGQRLIQGSPDIFLGWGNVNGQHFYVRQLADMKGSIKFIEGNEDGLDGIVEYCSLCGWALALAHAKSADPAMIAGYCGRSATLDDAIAKFAIAYMTQTDADHEMLRAAQRSGRIDVASG